VLMVDERHLIIILRWNPDCFLLSGTTAIIPPLWSKEDHSYGE
jgi:hypothetical protein